MNNPSDVRPPSEHADKLFHWISTPQNPRGEPMLWHEADAVWLSFEAVIIDAQEAADEKWRYIAPCEPPPPPPPTTTTEGSFW